MKGPQRDSPTVSFVALCSPDYSPDAIGIDTGRVTWLHSMSHEVQKVAVKLEDFSS